jgi:hypothetical protein
MPMIDYDPLTGLKTTFAVEDGELRVNYAQNNEATYERMQKLRNAEEYSRQGIKNNLWHAVHITEQDAMRMLVEDGFDVYKEPAKDIRAFLRRNRDKYGHLFATTGRI